MYENKKNPLKSTLKLVICYPKLFLKFNYYYFLEFIDLD